MLDAARISVDTISLWIVEDDLEYRDAFVELLQQTAGLTCSNVFYAFEEVQSAMRGAGPADAPDVILMDIGLPGMDGIQGVRWLKDRLPDVPIVMLTVSDQTDRIFDAFRAGASGYLLKDTPVDRIVAAIREASHGGTLMPAPVAGKVLDFFTRSAPTKSYDLTQREMEVLSLMAEGHAHRHIADVLFLSVHTIENHLRSIYRKLHVNSGIEAVSKAYRERLV